MSLSTEVVAALTPEQYRDVLRLTEAAELSDGKAPFNEAALLDLQRREGVDGLALMLAYEGPTLVGFAHVDSRFNGVDLQLAVDPAHRRHRVARTMLGELGLDATDPDHRGRLQSGIELSVWSFGDLPPARAWARADGFRKVRELLVMGRELTDDIPEPDLGEVTLRAFRDSDAADWIRVNARAFAHHPEQGAITLDDLHARMHEDWFDPADFLVATTQVAGREQLIGYHWTKRHSPTLGEVYVIGVDPDHAGAGLGRKLLHAGLRHLRSRGSERVILYVEADQEYVVRLYESTGFDVINRDVKYVAPPLGGVATAE
ncbi:mycothiol synthase [Granulicoccus phenolivorans]|uniref:mycothiol synthase n=1 Tax=Granulicoccus phenolivorans TaxID=266854 RepID=UPI0003FE61E2|nr:mycothiol synthase [Granulicoccus phenolivorans]